MFIKFSPFTVIKSCLSLSLLKVPNFINYENYRKQLINYHIKLLYQLQKYYSNFHRNALNYFGFFHILENLSQIRDASFQYPRWQLSISHNYYYANVNLFNILLLTCMGRLNNDADEISKPEANLYTERD